MARLPKIKFARDGVTVQGDLAVTGATTHTGALTYTSLAVSGAMTVGTTLTVTGAITGNGAWTIGNAVGDTVTVNGTPTFAEAVSCSKTLIVTGAVDFNSTGDIADTLTCSKGSGTGLAVTTNATVGGTLTVAGAVDFNGAGDIADTLTCSKGSGTGLAVTTNATVGGTLAVTGAASIGGNLAVTGVLTAGSLVVAGTFTATDFAVTDDLTVGDDAAVAGDLTVTGATVLNGAVTLGDASADAITVTGQVVGDIEFGGATSHGLIGEANQDLTITAAGTGNVSISTSGLADAIHVEDSAGLVTLAGALTVTGATLLNGAVTLGDAAADVITVTGEVAGDIEFGGATSHGLLGEANQDLTLTAAGTGNISLSTSGLADAIHIEDSAGLVTLAGALTVTGATLLNGAVTLGDATGDAVTFTGQVAGNIEFGGAASHSLIGEADQTLIVNSAGTGHLHLGTAGDANAIEIEDVSGDVTVAQALAVTGAATLSSTLQVDGAVSVGTGGGAAWTVTGPSDQNSEVIAPASRTLTLKSNNAAALVCDASSNVQISNDLEMPGDNGDNFALKYKTVEVTGFSGASATATNFIPAGAIVMALTARVTTLITSGDGGASWTLGHAGDADEWGTGLAFTAGTTVDVTDWTAATVAGIPYAAATSVVMAPNAGTFSAGAVRLAMWYYEVTAPTA